MTALDLITAALEHCTILGPGEAPAPEDSTLAFGRLNNLIDGWNADPWLSFNQPMQTFILNHVSPYTVGPGGEFAPNNILRPVLVTAASITPAGSTLRLPLRTLNPSEWAEVEDPLATGARPELFYCDYASPLANFYVQPNPVGAATLSYWMLAQLAPFVTLQDIVTAPPGYLEALEFDLAVTIAAAFGKNAPQLVVQKAVDAKTRIRQANARALKMALDQGMIPQPAVAPPPNQ